MNAVFSRPVREFRRHVLACCLAGTAVITSLMPGLASAEGKANNFAANPAVVEFARQMQDKHGFDAQELLQDFSRIAPNGIALQAIRPPVRVEQRSWQRYRPRFVNEQRISRGLKFWSQNEETLKRAQKTYGVPAEFIVAIIGVETEYGRNTGSFGVMEALASLAFNYPPRAEFFRSELEEFLILARENQFDRLSVKGSFAGALGIPQFMPGSQRKFATDFDGDGVVDLRHSVVDAIGSVASFFVKHGWKPGEPVAVPVRLTDDPEEKIALEARLQEQVKAGILPTLKLDQLGSIGIQPTRTPANAGPETLAAVVDLVSPGQATEYWLGFNNFYVITRYNRSSFYAMSVLQLADALKKRHH